MSAAGGVRRALIAVADKAGVVELARELTQLGVEIVSSGGTAAALRDAGIDVTTVSEVTGSPEMFGGRVKTLHPRIHGGILADRRHPEHVRELEEHGIEPFDLVVVNLYPFRRAMASGAEADEVIENIDVGGPAMVRAAAKNFESVAVVVEPARYGEIIEGIRRSGGVEQDLRRRLAAEAFAHTAGYDVAIASWFARVEGSESDPRRFPRSSASRSTTCPTFATGRTRISVAHSTRRTPAPGCSAGRRCSRERCPTTTGWTSSRPTPSRPSCPRRPR